MGEWWVRNLDPTKNEDNIQFPPPPPVYVRPDTIILFKVNPHIFPVGPLRLESHVPSDFPYLWGNIAT